MICKNLVTCFNILIINSVNIINHEKHEYFQYEIQISQEPFLFPLPCFADLDFNLMHQQA